MGKRTVTFMVSGNAGWIGKAKDRMGRFFSGRQEFTTDDPFMINALEKSGVASIVNDEMVDGEAIGIPGAAPLEDDTPVEDQPLEQRTNAELRELCIERGIAIPKRISKAEYVKAIEAALEDEGDEQ